MNNNLVLMHHGIKGQKWGERRYQNKDGTWTAEGKARRRNPSGVKHKYGDLVAAGHNIIHMNYYGTKSDRDKAESAFDTHLNNYMACNFPKLQEKYNNANRKIIRGLALGAVLGGTVLATAIELSPAAVIGGAYFGGAFGALLANGLPSVQSCKQQYEKLKRDTGAKAMDEAAENYRF